jgi:hypothetical protein
MGADKNKVPSSPHWAMTSFTEKKSMNSVAIIIEERSGKKSAPKNVTTAGCDDEYLL